MFGSRPQLFPIALLWLAACGGKSSGHAGSGGSTQTGCDYGGVHYPSGAAVPANGCGSCTCRDDQLVCSSLCKPAPCLYEGQSYQAGEQFVDQAGDQCTCQSDGSVVCAEQPMPIPLPSCQDVDSFYANLISEARSCDPAGREQCTLRVPSGLPCGCDTFVNAQNYDSNLAQAFMSHHMAEMCDAGVSCEPCPAPAPALGRCDSSGQCVDVVSAGIGCKVDGIVYPSGAGKIPDPTSCNQCSCDNGKLACTEIACDKPCPAGTQLATSCAACGPTDACLVVEYACRPTCTDTCAGGSCINGACITGQCG